MLYRPPTYLYKKDIPSHNKFLQGVKIEDIVQINEAIYQIGQSAEAVMTELDMPLFRWAEKLVGTNQFSESRFGWATATWNRKLIKEVTRGYDALCSRFISSMALCRDDAVLFALLQHAQTLALHRKRSWLLSWS